MKKFYSILAMLLMVTILAGCGKKEEPKPAEQKDAPKEKGVSGETFTNDAAKVSVNLPEGWYYEASESSISAYPEGGGFMVNFEILKADELDAALEEVDKIISAEFKNVVLGDAEDYDVNGMPGIFVQGTADGVLLAIGVINTPVSGSSLMVGAWGDPDAVKKYDKEIRYIFNNVKPLN
ncbi:MAG: hypothetical protein IAE91_08605 [Ignavibacteriaceae bacterium]|nr:hypothetical protein [Ignavibacteriaceae bacterium]